MKLGHSKAAGVLADFYRGGLYVNINKKESEKERVTKLFDNYVNWIKDTMTTEEQPYIQVVSVFTGAQE